MADETSLKGIIQGMMFDNAELMQGTVISASPLKIQMANDEKLIINERITVVPRHLSDYTTTATYTVGDGSLSSVTTYNGDDSHRHSLSAFTLTKGTITVYNALKTGDTVYVLSLNRGKLYYVLDRVVS
ncbi:MAG: DUF2577 domain-containing protein [Lachnospiraceae bacterium]|nr:DUF2577 domain-containing protein [Lachnospiraceae bacterium]